MSLLDEKLYSFDELAKLLKTQCGSTINQLNNWADRGVLSKRPDRKLVVLEFRHIGGHRKTSLEAVRRFHERVNPRAE